MPRTILERSGRLMQRRFTVVMGTARTLSNIGMPVWQIIQIGSLLEMPVGLRTRSSALKRGK
jgi:hypothetical protein